MRILIEKDGVRTPAIESSTEDLKAFDRAREYKIKNKTRDGYLYHDGTRIRFRYVNKAQ